MAIPDMLHFTLKDGKFVLLSDESSNRTLAERAQDRITFDTVSTDSALDTPFLARYFDAEGQYHATLCELLNFSYDIGRIIHSNSYYDSAFKLSEEMYVSYSAGVSPSISYWTTASPIPTHDLSNHPKLRSSLRQTPDIFQREDMRKSLPVFMKYAFLMAFV